METEYRVGTIGADDAGAPHRRERIWIVAHSNVSRLQEQQLFHADLLVGSSDAATEEAGSVASQHPIGQLADPDVFGRLHGQPEVKSTERGIDAQREPEPSGEDVADALCIGQPGPGEHVGPRHPEAYRNREASGLVDGSEGGSGRWKSKSGLGGAIDGMATGMVGHWGPGWEDGVPRVATGVPKRVDRLKAIGNGQVPAAVVLAWHTLYSRIQRS